MLSEINILEIVLRYLIPCVLGGIIGALTTRIKKIKADSQKKEETLIQKQETCEESLKALLRNELVRCYREYEEKGEMSILDRENVESMFQQYTNLGGNGTTKHLIDELLELPTKIVK